MTPDELLRSEGEKWLKQASNINAARDLLQLARRAANLEKI